MELVEYYELLCYAQFHGVFFVFYDVFCSLCKEKGVTPSKAAVDAGFSKSLVSKWKDRPDITPSSDVVKKVAMYFGVPVSTLLGEEKQPADGELSGDEKAMLDLFRRASEDSRRLALLALEHGEQH